MNHKLTDKEWVAEFKEFLETNDVPVPEVLSQKILKRIHSGLNPPSWRVFIKLLAVHSTAGTASLLICDQFGMNFFQTRYSLAKYFMTFGHSMCMVLCGFLFIGLSVTCSRLVLNSDEFKILKKNIFIQAFFLSILSLVAFIAFGAELALGTVTLWLLGALLGGFSAAQFQWITKQA